MNESLFSEQWYRVAQLQPRWKRQNRMRQEHVRGEQWFWLSDSSGKHSIRFNQQAWELIGRCDGQSTLDVIWQNAIQAKGDQAPTQSETLALLEQAIKAELIECPGWTQWNNFRDQKSEQEKQLFQGRFSPTGIRFDLGNPKRFVDQIGFLSPLFFSPFGWTLWSVLILAATATGFQSAALIAEQSAQFLLQPQSWVFMAIVYFPIKFLHELAHALAAKRYFISVNQCGLSWMLIYPAPFVDLTAAANLSSKRKRIAISLAGITAELGIAATALLLWQASEPGVPKHLLMACWLTAGFSTLMFNANPFMKMDGYYALTDALSLPNLAQRSQAFWQTLIIKIVLGSRGQQFESMQTDQSERFWLLLYSPLSWLWRGQIFYWSIVWIGATHRVLAYSVAVGAFFTLLVMPMFRLFKRINSNAHSGIDLASMRFRCLSILTIALVAIVFIPLPDRRIERAIWTLPESHQAKASAEGFIPTDIPDPSHPQTTQIDLKDPLLVLQDVRLRSQLQSLIVQQQQALQTDLNLVAQLGNQITNLKVQQNAQLERLAELSVRAPSVGKVDWISSHNLAGQWVVKGQLLGLVSEPATAKLQLVVDQSLAGRISQENPRYFWVGNDRKNLALLSAQGERQTPAALERLPSAALSQMRGGSIETDPLDKQHLRPLSPSFMFDVQPATNSTSNPTMNPRQLPHGSTTWVVLDFGHHPLGLQVLRSLQETIRLRFAVRTA